MNTWSNIVASMSGALLALAGVLALGPVEYPLAPGGVVTHTIEPQAGDFAEVAGAAFQLQGGWR